jgi:hypothetical protein
MPGWQWCSAQLNHSVCAAGLGNATSTKTDHQASPSRDGSSSKFDIAGRTGYSNALWWKTLTPDSSVSHFVYDLWFYVDHPDFSQALEFDTNQTSGGTRWVFGTECNFKDTGKWDLWDGKSGKWVPSAVPCTPFSANAWHHLVWQFERTGNQVHYVSLSVDGQTISVDVYHDAQPNFSGEDIDVAFQMDGDSTQQSYNVWLDQVTLTQW